MLKRFTEGEQFYLRYSFFQFLWKPMVIYFRNPSFEICFRGNLDDRNWSFIFIIKMVCIIWICPVGQQCLNICMIYKTNCQQLESLWEYRENQSCVRQKIKFVRWKSGKCFPLTRTCRNNLFIFTLGNRGFARVDCLPMDDSYTDSGLFTNPIISA